VKLLMFKSGIELGGVEFGVRRHVGSLKAKE
jgi:hypothetical protein